MEPKAQAEWEWENQPEVRKTARTKEIYVLARTAELDGTHRSFRPSRRVTRPAGTVPTTTKQLSKENQKWHSLQIPPARTAPALNRRSTQPADGLERHDLRGLAVGESSSTGTYRALVAGDNFVGFAHEGIVNPTSGTKRVKVRQKGIVRLTVVGVTGVADHGDAVYASADGTFTKASTSNTQIGKVSSGSPARPATCTSRA
jgi:hypothetical protein